MSILVVVITFLAVEYKQNHSDPIIAWPIYTAIMSATGASVFAGILALAALIYLRSGRGSISYLIWAFAALNVIMTGGIMYVVDVMT